MANVIADVNMLAKKVVVTTMLLAIPVGTVAKDYAVTAYGSYRDGGRFTDAITNENLDLDSSAAASLAFDFPFDRSRQYQIFVSHQRTDLKLTGVSSAGTAALGMDISYLHFGGTNFFGGQIGKGPYMVGGIGATYFDPARFDSELRASMNLGIGYQWPLGERLALRFEARGFATLINSSGGFFCSGGCVISIKGDTLTQGEVMLGLTTRF